MINKEQPIRKRIAYLLKNQLWAKIAEILIVFITALVTIKLLSPLIGDSLVGKQAVIWLANILMLLLVWLGMYLRGQNYRYLGLTFGPVSRKEWLKSFLQVLLIFVLTIAGFVLGSIIMANITGIPENADMSGYNYLQNNVFMFILTLFGVYIVSSFGEEVIYRAFLINRISELGFNAKYGNTIAIILSAIIFGLAHYQWGPMGIVQTGFMGLALGICFIKFKKRLWLLIFAHAIMDTILMAQMYLSST